MGNICHAGPTQLGAGGKKQAASAPRPAPTFGRDPTLRREDYIFSQIQSATCLTKLPGSINGQQFLIEDCRDCDIFLLDNCTSVQIDGCVNCRVVVGPCQGSVFLRDCKGCTLVCAVQQFRTRDCEGVDVYLYSATEPIIETSSHLRFACFPLAYFSLAQQFQQADFSVWNNHWSEIYDFTPDQGGWKPLPMLPHESPLTATMPIQETGFRSLWRLPSWTAEELGLTPELPQLVVPLTSGLCARKDGIETAFVCFVVPNEAVMLAFVTALALKNPDEVECSDPTLLIRTRQMKLTQEQAKQLFLSREDLVKKAVEAAHNTPGSVAMEFQGPHCYQHVKEKLQDSKFASEMTVVSGLFLSSDTATATNMGDLVFRQWKPTI